MRRSPHHKHRHPRHRRRGIPTWALGGASAVILLAAIALFVATSKHDDPQRSDPAPTGSSATSSVASELTTPTQRTTTTTADEPTVSTDADDGPPSWRALAGWTVGLDAGHAGGNATHPTQIARFVDAGRKMRKACDAVGASTRAGYPEHAFTLDVALRMQRILEHEGASVVMTRTNDTSWGPCVNRRAAVTNQADVAISLHADGDTNPSHRGFHVIQPGHIAGLTDDIHAPSRRLAQMMRAALLAGSGLPASNYRGKEGIDTRVDLVGLRLSDVPKVFVELGNMRNTKDASLLESAQGREAIARALVEGLAAWAASHPAR